MGKIKLKETEKGIKLLDKSSVITSRMRLAYIKNKGKSRKSYRR